MAEPITKNDVLKFAAWMAEVRRLARPYPDAVAMLSNEDAEEAWREYYDEDFSPDDALTEDLSYADD